jgi:hypothetical protein
LPTLGAFGVQPGVGWEMWVVRTFTFAPVGHACVVVGVDDDMWWVDIVEAMPDGMRRRTVTRTEFIWSAIPLAPGQGECVAAKAVDDVGKPYAWPSIAGFILRWFKVKWTGKAFDHPDLYAMCSEEADYLWRSCGTDLFPGVAPNAVAPADLWRANRRYLASLNIT